jgi:putative transposase
MKRKGSMLIKLKTSGIGVGYLWDHWFKSMSQAQRFVTAHTAVSNLFNLGRDLVRAEHYRELRVSALNEWSRVVA